MRIKALLGYTALLAVIAMLVIGGYWVAKNVSYAIWYEDMVKRTVTEMVKEDALK